MPQPIRQAAALAIRDGLVCLVSSRNGRRWVLPKGHVEKGHTPEQTAAHEAWEEAGLKGKIDPHPLGEYRYNKRGRDHEVTVYRMTLGVEHDHWPESVLRDREWVPFEEAVRRVHEMELRDLLLEVADCVGVLEPVLAAAI
jgi:8-oxo-dGTP pyrophosphatase MutT (NUDIX family)